MPVLSETERSARSTACFVMENQIAFPEHGGAADVAASLAPDVIVEIHVVRHRTRVRDRRNPECGGAVVELPGRTPAPAAEILLVEQRVVRRAAADDPVDVAGDVPVDAK